MILLTRPPIQLVMVATTPVPGLGERCGCSGALGEGGVLGEGGLGEGGSARGEGGALGEGAEGVGSSLGLFVALPTAVALWSFTLFRSIRW